jgi:predicted benzoate:H+ symporter BenE
MRAALTPSAPHMSLPVVIAALVVITAIFWMLGMRSFMKRALG